MRNFHANAVLLLALIILIGSCKQSDEPKPDPIPPGNCRITSMRQSKPGDTVNYQFSYDNDKRLISYTEIGLHSSKRKDFIYGSSYILANYFTNDLPTERDTIWLTSQGFPDRVTNILLPGDIIVYQGTWTHDTNGRPESVAFYQPFNNKTLNVYYFYTANGDRESIITDENRGEGFSYYTDKPTRVGDPELMLSLLYLGTGKWTNNVHLTKGHVYLDIQTNQESRDEYSYEFDDQGRITKVIKTSKSGEVEISSIQQTCD